MVRGQDVSMPLGCGSESRYLSTGRPPPSVPLELGWAWGGSEVEVEVEIEVDELCTSAVDETSAIPGGYGSSPPYVALSALNLARDVWFTEPMLEPPEPPELDPLESMAARGLPLPLSTQSLQ